VYKILCLGIEWRALRLECWALCIECRALKKKEKGRARCIRRSDVGYNVAFYA